MSNILWNGSPLTSMSTTITGFASIRPRRYLEVKEFLAIEDKDLQKYVFMKGLVRSPCNFRKTDNEVKLAYYEVSECAKCNNKGVFYRHSSVTQWIVYDKKTKKCKVSKNVTRIYDHFINDYFSCPEFINGFVKRITPTFCKKIIEGKIQTIGDIIQYHRSYTIRDKSASLLGIYKFAILNAIHLVHLVEDPENLEYREDLYVPIELYETKAFRFKVREIDNLNIMLNEWQNKQGKRYDKILGFRDEEAGDINREDLEP